MLKIETSNILVDVLKSIADQYFRTSNSSIKKKGISDLRINSTLYSEIQERQKRRCVICGALFDGSVDEHLNHIIPFRLIGDNSTGVNWQILCPQCSRGKGEWLSSLQLNEAYNWVYSVESRKPSEKSRFIVLIQHRKCNQKNCGKGPLEKQLKVKRRYKTGLPVVDNLKVLCSEHY